MGTRHNAGLNGATVPVATVEVGEYSAADLETGKVAKVRLNNGAERVFAGQLLIMALKNGAVIVDDSRFNPNADFLKQAAVRTATGHVNAPAPKPAEGPRAMFLE
jgi:hypothetical protein